MSVGVGNIWRAERGIHSLLESRNCCHPTCRLPKMTGSFSLALSQVIVRRKLDGQGPSDLEVRSSGLTPEPANVNNGADADLVKHWLKFSQKSISIPRLPVPMEWQSNHPLPTILQDPLSTEADKARLFFKQLEVEALLAKQYVDYVDSLRSSLGSYLSSLGPTPSFRRLPNEVLILILKASAIPASGEPDLVDASVGRYLHTGPGRRLSQVCRLWRSLAIKLPELWTVITFARYTSRSPRRERANKELDWLNIVMQSRP
ncbi:hypothetical protein HGRIS_014686 [Hohenbuehelia grisea]|uniref:F-box domain-containing protein n=1 Tax=Hohenbuehelia grisea TaxID=104357 RepID=A0ABR3JUH3_9AGAR